MENIIDESRIFADTKISFIIATMIGLINIHGSFMPRLAKCQYIFFSDSWNYSLMLFII